MRPEVLAHARLQNRLVAYRVQPTAVDDADASMAAMPAVLDQPFHAGERFGSRHAVQVVPVVDDVFTSFQLPDLAPIDAVRNEVAV